MNFHLNIANAPRKLYSPEKAERIAAEMAAGDDDGWAYTVKHDPKGTGYSFIVVTDEDGEEVGTV